MDLGLGPSGLASTMLSDITHLTSDILLTSHTPQNQNFDQSTSLLMDQMHNTHITPDSTHSSLIVSAMIAVCTLISFFFFQNTLSSPLDLQLSRASEDQLLASGNVAHLQSQLVVKHQRRKIGEMENRIRLLEMDLVMWKTRCTSIQ